MNPKALQVQESLTLRGGLMAEPTTVDPPQEELSTADLVEEVSIDGMCGVY